MKSTGIFRRVDELGRVVIPMELRKKFGIEERDPMEIYVDGSAIVLKKQENTCVFCGKKDKVHEYKDKLVCEKCLNELKKQ